MSRSLRDEETFPLPLSTPSCTLLIPSLDPLPVGPGRGETNENFEDISAYFVHGQRLYSIEVEVETLTAILEETRRVTRFAQSSFQSLTGTSVDSLESSKVRGESLEALLKLFRNY